MLNSVDTNPLIQHPMTTMSKAWSIGFGDHKSTGGSSQALWAYVGIYLGLSLLICLLFVIKLLLVLIVSIKASRKLSEDITNAIFHAPLHWLDTVPTGRILNQFTANFTVIDESMADGLGFFLNQVLQMVAILGAGALVSPFTIIIAGILFSACVYLARLYLPRTRDAKRIESVTRSPIFEQLGSAIAAGLNTIRAYSMADVYVQR